MCILRDLPWHVEGTLSHDAGGAPQFYMFPWKYFFSMKGKRSKEIKRELFT
jgi:hypothetical protein